MFHRQICCLLAILTGFLFTQDNLNYLILTSPELLSSASIISDLYEEETEPEFHLNTIVITTDIIYDQYPGVVESEAIRNFVIGMIDENDSLSYLLILGDETVVPPFYDIYGVPSDDFYSSLQLTIPQSQLSTGRIPISDAQVAIQIANKIRNYIINPPTGHWKSSALLIADDAHKAGGGDIMVEISHVSNSNNIFEQIKDVLEVNCLYGTEYQLFYGGGIPTLPEMTSDVLDAINSGVGWINYIGHGNETTLADELILDMERDLTFMSPPEGKLPVWVVGSCDLGHYDDAECLTEALISKPDGAIAVITTTRLILSQPVGAYLDRLYSNVYNYSIGALNFRLGDLVRESKTGSSDYVFQLFGDPAMPIILPRQGNIINSYPDTCEVLTQNSVHVLENYQNDFSHLTVYGPPRFIHQIYDGWVNLDYQLPGERIYSGEFVGNAQFYLPLDYPLCESSPVELKVFSENVEQPFNNKIETISGIPVIPPGTITDFFPPSIILRYEGSEVMENQVINSPFLFEVIIQDTSGINLMNLPGHQIQYQIDASSPVNITDQFTYNSNAIVEGVINLLISDVLSGSHILQIKAWDNANNRAVFSRTVCFTNCDFPEVNESSLWTSITSLLTPNGLTGFSNGDQYAATTGGLLKLSLSSNTFENILPGETLKYSNLLSVNKDSYGNLWLGSGYPGTLQIYHPNEGLLRIIDNLNFDEISSIYYHNNSVYAIGKIDGEPCIIEFRLDDNDLPYYQATYQSFPVIPNSISHISFDGDTIYIATSAGIFSGSIGEGMLSFSVSWDQVFNGWQPKLFFPGENPIMVTATEILVETNSSWNSIITNLQGTILDAGWTSDGHFYVLSSTRFYEFDNTFSLITGYPLSPPSEATFTSYYSDIDHHILGVNKRGIRVINRETLSATMYIPNTLFSNEMNAITYATDGSVAGVSRKGMFHFAENTITNFIASSQTSGYVLDQLEETNFSAISMNYSPGSNLPWSIVESSDANFLFSNSGISPNQPGFRGGVIEIDPITFEIAVYDTSDGILDGLNGIYNPYWTNQYLTINQIKKDHQGNLWVVNPYSEVYNHISAIKLADGSGWAHVTGPDDTSYLPQEVAFDGFGRAWFAIQYDVPMNNNISEYSNGGLRVLDFGQTFDDESDDVWISVVNEDILPSSSVWSIEIDLNNHVWVVTSGGIQGYEIENSDEGIVLIELLDWPAYTQIPFHIGDHIRVDAENNKWITTRHHGVFGILWDNSLLENGAGFNIQNSGILSDLVYDVSFDGQTNHAAFSTLNGISIYDMSFLHEYTFVPVGDVNGDNQTDVGDVVIIVFYILGLSEPGSLNQFQADMNMDGMINIIDVVSVVDYILGPSLLKIQYPGKVQILIDQNEVTIIPDGDIIAYHLVLNSDSFDQIEVLSKDWMGFQNGSEFIALNLTACEESSCDNNLKLSMHQDNFIESGRGYTRDGYCIDVLAPEKWSLRPPYPNPFNPTVTIAYSIPEQEELSICIYDILGRQVDELFNGIQQPGEHSISWNGERYASGLYLVRINYMGKSKIKKIMLLK